MIAKVKYVAAVGVLAIILSLLLAAWYFRAESKDQAERAVYAETQLAAARMAYNQLNATLSVVRQEKEAAEKSLTGYINAVKNIDEEANNAAVKIEQAGKDQDSVDPDGLMPAGLL